MTEQDLADVEDTVEELLDGNDELLEEAQTVAKRKRHETVVTADPNANVRKIAHSVETTTRKAVTDRVLELVESHDDVPDTPSPDAMDTIQRVCREYADDVMENIAVGEKMVAEMLREHHGSRATEENQQRWDQLRQR